MKLNQLHSTINEGWKDRAKDMLMAGALGAGLTYGTMKTAEKPQTHQKAEPEKQIKKLAPKTQEPVPEPKTQIDLDELMQYITHFEGKHLKAYNDSVGKRTIGIGFNLDRPGAKEDIKALGYNFNNLYSGRDALSNDDMYKLLEKDTLSAINDTKRIVNNFDNLPKDIQLVVIDMVYNLGPSKFSGFKKTINALNNNNFKMAAREMQNSKWYGQVGRRSKHHISIVGSHN